MEEHRAVDPSGNGGILQLEVAIFDVSNNAAARNVTIGYEMNLPRYIRCTKGTRPFVRCNVAPLWCTSIPEENVESLEQIAAT